MSKIVAIDFDGTCVAHTYPKIGHEIGAPPVLRALVESGHRLILWTVRSGAELAAAESWFAEHKIPLYGVNENPEQARWSTSPKAHADMFIDDLALGCPLIRSKFARAYVDWIEVARFLYSAGYIDLLTISRNTLSALRRAEEQAKNTNFLNI
jgi:hypothetical protein